MGCLGIPVYRCQGAVERRHRCPRALGGRIQLTLARPRRAHVDLRQILLARQFHHAFMGLQILGDLVDPRERRRNLPGRGRSFYFGVARMLVAHVISALRGIGRFALTAQRERAGDFPETESSLLLAEHLLDERLILPPFPRETGLRVNTVDEDVHVRMLAVAMRDDDRLVLRESQSLQHTIGDTLHRRAVDRVPGIEAQRDVVDRLLDAVALRCRRSHELRGELRIVGRQVTSRAPRHSLPLLAAPARGEIGGQRPEAPSAARNGDHVVRPSKSQPRRRTIERISASVASIASALTLASPCLAVAASCVSAVPMRPSSRISSAFAWLLRGRGAAPSDTSRTYRAGGFPHSRARWVIASHSAVV